MNRPTGSNRSDQSNSSNRSNQTLTPAPPLPAHPFVSICTPTFNRRPFIEAMFKCFRHQTYPMDRMEWIILDDGTDKIGDLIELSQISQIKYFAVDEKMTLGRKRNLIHEKSKGDVLVYMDDDDYYPPERVAHAVETLRTTPGALCAGSSELNVWFEEIGRMVQFGPYGPNHATAGTFAFRRELLKYTKYEDTASLAEEKYFLRHYQVPFVQLDARKTILVFSHDHNTFDKRKLLTNMENNPYQKYVDRAVDDYIDSSELIDFYKNRLREVLVDYAPGRPDKKPDVLEQIDSMRQKRETAVAKRAEERAAAQQVPQSISDSVDSNGVGAQMNNSTGNTPLGIIMKLADGTSANLTANQVVDIIQRQSDEISRLKSHIQTSENATVPAMDPATPRPNSIDQNN